ncbi:MAG: SDR family NAD(P)-dependent oxidoreductase, partial [Thalassolituus sp.]
MNKVPKHSLKHQLKERHKRTVFITGAAAGIGRAVAVQIASKGWIVGAADVDEIGLARLRDEIGADLCLPY